MSEMPNRVMTLHAFLLPAERKAKVPTIPAPAECSRWIPGTDMDWQDNGMPQRRATHRYWLGVWNSSDDADAFMSNAGQFFGALSDAEDAWHAKLLPYMHRGTLQWGDLSSPPNVFGGFHAKPAAACPILLMTSVKPRRELDKAILFGNTVSEVRRTVQKADGLILEMLLLTSDFENFDGGTLTLWKNEMSALNWAYRGDAHKHAMKLDHEKDLMERSSFARFAVDKSIGTWNGVAPLPDLSIG